GEKLRAIHYGGHRHPNAQTERNGDENNGALFLLLAARGLPELLFGKSLPWLTCRGRFVICRGRFFCHARAKPPELRRIRASVILRSGRTAYKINFSCRREFAAAPGSSRRKSHRRRVRPPDLLGLTGLPTKAGQPLAIDR